MTIHCERNASDGSWVATIAALPNVVAYGDIEREAREALLECAVELLLRYVRPPEVAIIDRRRTSTQGGPS